MIAIAIVQRPRALRWRAFVAPPRGPSESHGKGTVVALYVKNISNK
jgi:hypothetical protein